MKRATKAALLSGLIFPGIGHMVLKQYLRGSVLMLAALMALSVIVTAATKRALTVVDRIYSGEIPIETRAITDAIANSTSGADSQIVKFAVFVLAACWLIGIIDSYRRGI